MERCSSKSVRLFACEAVKKSKKLLCSQVKVGSQVKQIVSGIKAHYTPEEMVGKKVMVLVNLKPAKLAGVLSEGMLLCAEDAEGNLALMTPEKEMRRGQKSVKTLPTAAISNKQIITRKKENTMSKSELVLLDMETLDAV